jgi:hypothetical protein
LPFFTLPLMYGPEITTCCYKGLLLDYVMLCYGFLTKASLAPYGSQAKDHAIPYSTEQDTLL